MGMVPDLKQRQDHIRVDDHALRYTLSQARSAIYESGYVVNSTSVKAMLGKHSLVPASVYIAAYLNKHILIRAKFRMHFPPNLVP
jgi:hypothetical protein